MNKQNTEQLKKEFEEKEILVNFSEDGEYNNYMDEITKEEIWNFFLPHLISSDEIEHKCRINIMSREENGSMWDECKVCGKKWYPSEQEQNKHDKTTPSHDEIKREAESLQDITYALTEAQMNGWITKEAAKNELLKIIRDRETLTQNKEGGE